MHSLQLQVHWPVFPGDDERFCCEGAVYRDKCMCWEPVHDLEQAPAQEGAPLYPEKMCSTCACRPGSPEHLTPDDMESSVHGVEDHAERGLPFYCHKGMRRIVSWAHPDGSTFVEVGAEHDFEPPIRDDKVPVQADGSPAFLCAGWLALNRRAAPLTLAQVRDSLAVHPHVYVQGRRVVELDGEVVWADTHEPYEVPNG